MRRAVALLGVVAFLCTVLLPAPAGFSELAWPTLGLLAWMALWWLTEAVPLSVTALLPLLVVPLIGLPQPAQILTQYANSTIFLILGGFLIGLAMERWQLHRRIAYAIIAAVGSHPRRLVLGVMIATAFVSMWVSNTSTTLMMLPVASSIVALVAAAGGRGRATANFATAMLLSVAYAATIGGLGTLIGSPSNALVQGFMAQNFGHDLSFATWMSFGIPTVVLLLPAAWWILTRVALPFELPPDALPRDAMRRALHELGPVSPPERRVALIALVTAALWISRPWLMGLLGLHGVTDTVIAIAAGLALFLVPSGAGSGLALLDADAMRKVPWDVLILFGGGLALAAAIQASTLSDTLGVAMRGMAHLPQFAVTVAVVLVIVLWTEFNSNTATAATFMPVLATMAAGDPETLLVLLAPAAMAASAGFMLPVGTPPNAIVFATGRITMRQMLRTGFLVDIAAVVVIAVIAGVLL